MIETILADMPINEGEYRLMISKRTTPAGSHSDHVALQYPERLPLDVEAGVFHTWDAAKARWDAEIARRQAA